MNSLVLPLSREILKQIGEDRNNLLKRTKGLFYSHSSVSVWDIKHDIRKLSQRCITLCSITNDGWRHANGNVKSLLHEENVAMLMSLFGLSLSLTLSLFPCLSLLFDPLSFPYSSVSLCSGDGGRHHPRHWHHCLQRLVRLHWGQTWEVRCEWVSAGVESN